MPAMTNPMDALKSFEHALKRGELKIECGRVDPDLIVHLDHPNGELRLTYAKMRGEVVGSFALLTPAEPYDGTPVVQLGYAVPQHLRKRGLGKAIAMAAIDEFTAGMARNGVKSFYVEAVVSTKNVASQKVAAEVVGGEPKDILDESSGKPAFQYMKKIDC